MFKNYGNENFFQYGVLVDDNIINGNTFRILRCDIHCDGSELYMFGDLTVNIDDEWIDRKEVMDYCGMTEETFNAVRFAVGCTEWYCWESFYDDDSYIKHRRMTKEEICEILKKKCISDDLDII